MRLPSRFPWARALAGVLLLAVLAVAVDLRRTGRAQPPVAARESAVAAFEAASRGAAARWAPDALGAADTALRDAFLAWSRQESRLLPWRDFRPVLARLEGAAALAREAQRTGDERLAEGRRAAEGAIREAQAVEERASTLVAATTLPAGQRAGLQRARLLLREAEALLGAGEVATARERASASGDALRAALSPALEAAARFTSRDQIATWRRWIDETRAWSRTTGRSAILVLKEKNVLVLLSKGAPVKTYGAEIGSNALGAKRHQGDRATPEGRYRVVKKKDRGQSRYHRALLLDYPNAADRERFAAARRRGEIPAGQGIGGLIEVHGDGGRGQNWTEGCVALSNRDIDDLFPRVGVGTRVTIVGGDGSDGAFSDLLARTGEGAENGKP